MFFPWPTAYKEIHISQQAFASSQFEFSQFMTKRFSSYFLLQADARMFQLSIDVTVFSFQKILSIDGFRTNLPRVCSKMDCILISILVSLGVTNKTVLRRI